MTSQGLGPRPRSVRRPPETNEEKSLSCWIWAGASGGFLGEGSLGEMWSVQGSGYLSPGPGVCPYFTGGTSALSSDFPAVTIRPGPYYLFLPS